MLPKKNKKRLGAATKSNSEEVVPSKKSLKRLKKGGIPSVSPQEEVVSEKKIVEDVKDGDTKKIDPTSKVKKPCTWLKLDKLDSELGNKSSLKSSEQVKEAKPTSHVRNLKHKRKRDEKGGEKGHVEQVTNEKQTAPREKKGKEIINGSDSKSKIQMRSMAKRKDAHQDTRKIDDASEKELGGLIFMCNAKTKPDCFKYQLMGVPAHRKEVVMSIKPGLKFFLYDYDVKLLYGVFEASSPGGMKLEPTAFGGGFPAQIRFIVHKDCLPLPESVFKEAIKDSYDEKKRKFKMELTIKQVRKLIDAFKPTPLLHPNRKSVVQEPTFSRDEPLMRQRYLDKYGNSNSHGNLIPLHHEGPAFHSTVPPRGPLFLTEQEYRHEGLQQGSRLLPVTSGELQPNHLLRNPASTNIYATIHQREVGRPDPSFLSEKDYRAYGLRGPQLAPNAAPPIIPDLVREPYNPVDDDTDLLVSRYLSQPMTAVEPYTGAHREPYAPPRTIQDVDRPFAPYSFREQSVFNHRPPEASRTRETGSMSAPVSHRYSFGGPSLAELR